MSHLDFNSKFFQSPIGTTVSKRPPIILAEIIFGAPGKNCNGAGICKILSIEGVRVNWKCPSAQAWLWVTGAGSLSLVFDRSTLLPAHYERYFGNQIFEIEEAYSIPSELLSLLNLDSFTLNPGQYPVEVSEFFLVIYF